MNDCLVHVTRADQAEMMRVIRNTCRQYMTRNPSDISADEQALWFESIKDSETVLPFLYQPRRQAAMGYGLIRKISEAWWVSGGLLPEHRGNGYGYLLFGELVEYVSEAFKQPCWLEVFASNVNAIKTYHALGFVDVSVDAAKGETIIVMRRNL